MPKPKLNQIIAVEKSLKERTHREYTGIYQSFKKPDPMQGFSRSYQPRDEEGEPLPGEVKHVQIKLSERIARIEEIMGALMDVTLTKEVGNTKAKADVVVGSKTLLAGVPISYLLYLEKQLVDLRTVLGDLPTLDPSDKWTWDEQQGFYKSDEVKTARTKKVTEFVIAAPPTSQHPAQVKEVTNDVFAGMWTVVKFSANMEPTEVLAITERIGELLKAVKFAREEANNLEVDQLKGGAPVFDYIFGR